ncbi:hypothetical protein M378DRAFT_9199 [Amanita muscaria Koide BX008]|uniref:Uncharacterized protein n=1 Tax=Amanita muscaria (strain Koide BX008) TaxID=946122 RepID=A0A0C2TLG0_AMAMK|nr:hypothetical protein M378DRAFT_9199 [Amanita muscaria Koide BX008]
MHIPVVCVNGVEVLNVAVDVRRSGKEVATQRKASPVPDFVEADDAFFNAVVAEIKRRRPPTTKVGKLYQKFKKWNQIRKELKDITLIAKRGEDKTQWSFLMTCAGRAAGIEDYDADWKVDMLRGCLLMPVKPRRYFWTPKNYHY